MVGTRSLFFRFFAVAFVLAASVFCVSAQSEDVEINVRPLRDFANELQRDIDSKKVDLSAPFLVELRGKLDGKGRLDNKASSFARTEGDPAMVETVKRGILAIFAAGYFEYLSLLRARDIVVLTQQDSSDFEVGAMSEFESATRAQSIRSMLELTLQITKQKKREPTATENDKKDLLLLNGVSIKAEDKSLVMSFKASASEIQKLIAETAAEQAKNGQ